MGKNVVFYLLHLGGRLGLGGKTEVVSILLVGTFDMLSISYPNYKKENGCKAEQKCEWCFLHIS